MEKLDREIKRLELLREGLREETIDPKAALDIILEHLIDLCKTIDKKD